MVKAGWTSAGRGTGERVLAGSQPHHGRYFVSLRSGFGKPRGRKYAAGVLAGVTREDQPYAPAGCRAQLSVQEKGRLSFSGSASNRKTASWPRLGEAVAVRVGCSECSSTKLENYETGE